MKILLLIAMTGCCFCRDLAHAGITAGRLRCEYRVNPLGIDELAPRLDWLIQSDERGQCQTAYRILVASSSDLLDADTGDLWDSGRVESSQTTQVVYQGKNLASRQRCFWKVRVWDRGGTASAWSKSAMWSMGLLKADDWKARYISYRDTSPFFKDRKKLFLPAARQYRKDFHAGKAIRHATVYATALGIYELHLNGKRVSDAYFAPGWTDYHQRAYYQTYDVTDLVQSGDNAIGAWVADGWYSGYVGFGLLTGMGTEHIGRYAYGKTPSVMMQLEIEYADGTRDAIVTDPSWKVTANGPIQQADLLMGEAYDARLEQLGWSTAGFDTARWDTAILAEDNGHPTATFYEARNPVEPGKHPTIQGTKRDFGFKRVRLEAFPGLPVRVTEELHPVRLTQRDKTTWIFDMGENFAGVIRLRVKGPAGHQIKLRYGEMLYPDGRLMTENLRRARATDFYTCRGDADGETYQPRFTFHGFQYVEVSNFPGRPNLDTVTGLVLHSDTPLTSTFECSDATVNQVFKNVVRTQRSNFLDLPTDCPQRDERMGWTGDAQVYVATATLNADVAAFYTKWLRELMESQRPSGAFPGYAPFPFQHGWDFGTAWADAGVICPWTIWQAYGDTRVIERCWGPMTRFMQWRKKTSQDNLGIAHGNNWGDWLAQGETTPLEFVDTIYFAISTKLMAEMATAIGHDQEALAYQEQFKAIKQAFRKRYLQDDGGVTVKTQTAHALALFADLVPRDMRLKTGQKLADMLAANGNRMATGFLGTRPLLPVLSSVDQHDLAVFLMQSHEFPSWGYEVDQGATSIWERWDSFTKEDGFGRHNAAMNSFAHYSFGAVCEWMFHTLAGIGSDGPGYSKIVIRPTPPAPGSNAQHKPIDWVNASYDSIRGKIESRWRVDGTRFLLDVTIPANATAMVAIPAANVESVTEGGKPVTEAEYVRVIGMEGCRLQLNIAAGRYHFESIGAIVPATKSLTTSEPIDRSLNPDDIDLSHARLRFQWNFTSDADIAKWPGRNNLVVEKRDGKTFLVGMGKDPQWITELPKTLGGPLAIQLKARAAKPVAVQFFWASSGGGFNPRQQTRRTLNASDKVNAYLFRIADGGRLKKLRFDPFSNRGELEIVSMTIYQL